jgi:hypothetical protein
MKLEVEGGAYFTGSIGIGTISPYSKLHVEQTDPGSLGYGVIQGVSILPEASASDIAGVYGENIATDYYGVGVQGQGGYIGLSGLVYPTGSQEYYAVYGAAVGGASGTNYGVYGEASGNGTNYAGYFAGDLAYTGSLIPASDERLKQNIQTMNGALDNILLLRPTTYEFRTKENALMNLAKGHQFGFLAQEVAEVFPNLVHENVHVSHPDKRDKTSAVKTEYIGLDYVSLIPVLTAAIQEQQAQIEAQQAQIEQLLIRMEALMKK